MSSIVEELIEGWLSSQTVIILTIHLEAGNRHFVFVSGHLNVQMFKCLCA